MMISQKEQNAGISKRALETIQARESRKTVWEHSGFKCTHIIDTPFRRLDLIETKDEVYLRDMVLIGEKATVAKIHLEYHEAQALCGMLRDLEPPEEFAKGNGKTK